MRITHLATFFIVGALFFVTMFNAAAGNYHIAAAYFTAGCSWIIVACYEYNERVFERAIQEIVRKQFSKPHSDE